MLPLKKINQQTRKKKTSSYRFMRFKLVVFYVNRYWFKSYSVMLSPFSWFVFQVSFFYLLFKGIITAVKIKILVKSTVSSFTLSYTFTYFKNDLQKYFKLLKHYF